MKSKFKKKLAYFVIVSVIISSISIMFLISDSFSGEIVELSLVQNTSVSCKSWTGITESDVAGNKITYSPITINFPAYTQFNVLSTKTGNTLSLLDPGTFVECKSLSSAFTDFNLVGGTVRTTFYGLQDNGQWITLKTVDRNISTISKSVLNQKQIIPTGAITGTEINSKLTSSKEFFTTQVKIIVNANFVFKGKSTGTLVNSGTAVMSNVVYVKLYNPITNPTPSTSIVVKLTSLSASSFDLKNYQSSTISLTAIGELPAWKDTEGVPYVEIVDPNRHVLGKFPMNVKKLLSSSTNTWEFKAVNINIPKSPQGTWNVNMHSNGDVRKISSILPSTDVKTFNIYDTSGTSQPSPVPVPTTQCMKLTSGQEICLSDDEFKSGGVCYAKTLQWCIDYHNEIISNPYIIPKTELGTASAFIAYKLTFDQGGIDSGLVPNDKSLLVDFEPLSFVGVPKQVTEKLQSVTLINSIDTSLLGASNISNLIVNTKFNVLVDGNDAIGDIPLNSAQLKRLGAYTTARDSYLMNQIVLNSADITRFLSSVELSDGQNITLQSTSDGTFDVTNTSGTHKGSFTGLIFIYDLKYTSDENFNPDPCKGLSGESLLSCRGGDPNNCVDFIAIQGDENCNIKEPQTGGDCQGLTPTECANKGKNGFTPTDNPLCDAFGIGCNPTGQGSDIIECPNGSFASKDTAGKSICLDNTKRTLVDPLNTITDIASGLDIQLIVIIFLVFLFIVLILVLAKRRRK